MADVTYDVRQCLGVLSDTGKGWKKEVNIISWNGREPKLDIREWNGDRSKMKKGITLSKNEASALFFYLSNLSDDAVIDKSIVPGSFEFSSDDDIEPFG